MQPLSAYTLSLLKHKAAVWCAMGAAALGLAAPAQADRVQWSIGVNSGGYYAPQPNVSVQIGNGGYYRPMPPRAPVYMAPAPVYVAPAPVYVAPAPVYVAPPPIYMAPAPVYLPPPPPRGYYHRPPPRYGHGAGHYSRPGHRH